MSKLYLQRRSTHSWSLKKHQGVMCSCSVTVERIHLILPYKKYQRDCQSKEHVVVKATCKIYIATHCMCTGLTYVLFSSVGKLLRTMMPLSAALPELLPPHHQGTDQLQLH